MAGLPGGDGAFDPIWVTGVGILTARGAGGGDAVRALRARLLAGDGGAGGAGAADLPLGEVDWAGLLGGRGLRHMSRGTLALLVASRFALEDAGLAGEAERDPERTGVVAGTATATAGLVADFDRTTLAEGPLAPNPAIFPQTVWNGPSSQVAIRYGLRGPNLTVSTGLSSGFDALLAAVRLLRRRRAATVLAGGFEELTPFFRVLFPPGKDGEVPRLAEGAAVLVLETRSTAVARDARPLAAILGGGSALASSPSAAGERLCTLVEDIVRDAGGGVPAPARTWRLAAAPAPAGGTGPAVDLHAVAGCGGGLGGALAAALAAAGAAGSAELVTADDGAARVGALLAGPAA